MMSLNVIILTKAISQKKIVLSNQKKLFKLKNFTELSPNRGLQIRFVLDDSIRDLLEVKPSVILEKYSLSDKPVHIPSIDIVFIETNIAKRMSSNSKRSGIVRNFQGL